MDELAENSDDEKRLEKELEKAAKKKAAKRRKRSDNVTSVKVLHKRARSLGQAPSTGQSSQQQYY